MKKFNILIIFLLVNSYVLGILIIVDNDTVDNDIVNSNTVSSKKKDKILLNESLETPKPSATSKKWTFMVYIDADNNLEEAGIDDINEMEMVGSDSNINVIVQIDRIPGYDSSNGDWTGAKRYNIIKDYSSSTISSTVVQELGEVNMGSANTLQNFIQWSKSNFPADNYALILWDHGSGIMYGADLGGVCWDDSNGDDYLTLSELSSTLSSPSYSVDLLGFDACLMGAVEVHYQLKDYVDVIIGSEDNEPGYGYPYNDILNYLRINPTATPQQLGQQIVITYDNFYPSNMDITQAAVKALTGEFISGLNNFISDLDAIAVSQKGNIQNARLNSEEYDETSYIDLYDFAQEVQTECSGPVDNSAQHLMNNISNIIVEERHSLLNPDANGLSIYFPEIHTRYSSNYESTNFANDLQWDEFLFKYYTGQVSIQYDDEYEENDDLSQAPILTQGTYYNLICNGSDFDVFNVSLEAGNTIDVQILFDHDEGDLDLYLYNSSEEVSYSESVTDNEQLSYTATESGYHVILVAQYTPYQEYQPYDLIISIDFDDIFEENDDPYSSAFIENNTLYTDLVCIDYDFYYFWAEEDYLINVTIEFNYTDGDLDLYLYDDNGYPLEESYSATNYENILYSADYSGWYIIWVYNYTNNLNYMLSANVTYIDDAYETIHALKNNNIINYSTPMSNGVYTDLVCMNYDFYNISLTVDTWINITIYFDNDVGDLDLYLYYVNTWTPFDYETVGFSISYTDNEIIYYEVETTGYYYILVDNYEINLNYNLSIHDTTEIWDDEFENNDWFDDATKLNTSESYNNLTSIDWDTYYIYVPLGYQITITLDYNYSEGDLDLYLIDYDVLNDTGWIIDYSISFNDQEQIIYSTQYSGNYHILVYLNDINMHYNLTIANLLTPSSGGGGGGGGGSGGGSDNAISGFPVIILMMIIGITVIYLIKKRVKI